MSYYKEIPKHGVSFKNNRIELILDNIKCGGCAKTITSLMQKLGLKKVVVDHENNLVAFDDPEKSELVISSLDKLRSLGYPVVDTAEGLAKLALQAKSYASCAIGKVS